MAALNSRLLPFDSPNPAVNDRLYEQSVLNGGGASDMYL
jgi:hypothetical protein